MKCSYLLEEFCSFEFFISLLGLLGDFISGIKYFPLKKPRPSSYYAFKTKRGNLLLLGLNIAFPLQLYKCWLEGSSKNELLFSPRF